MIANPAHESGTAPGAASDRVVACLGGEATGIELRPRPGAGPGELVLRLRVAGLCGTDLVKLRRGRVTAGQVLGHEVVGEVVAIGAGVDGFALGDRVVTPHHVACFQCSLCRRDSETLCPVFRENLLAPGGFAEHVRVGARAVALAARRVPATLADEAAVFLEPAACVLRGIRRAGLPESVSADPAAAVALVLGAGSMGLLHLLVLRAVVPALVVVVSDPLPARRVLAEELGAARAVLPGEPARRAVAELSQGLGAEAVFDCAGGAAALTDGLACSREGGAVVLFAHGGPGERADFELDHLFKHERRVLGTYSSGLAEQAAGENDELEFEAPADVEGGQLAVEELLPERQMPGLDHDQLIEHLLRVRLGDSPEGLVQGQVEQLVQDECAGESLVVCVGHQRQERLPVRQLNWNIRDHRVRFYKRNVQVWRCSSWSIVSTKRRLAPSACRQLPTLKNHYLIQ